MDGVASGTEVGGYAIGETLGRGGMGSVHRATRSDRPQPVALKLIDPGVWDDAARERFLREARLAAAVAHRHILPVYEAGEEAGRAYVAMRLQSCDLAALLQCEGRLGASRAVRLVAQVASALDTAHAHGLVHRDLKPSNVLIGEEDGTECAYLADFGIARAAFSDGGAAVGDMVGTVGYASPEQIRGEAVDHRTDVYALGCLLFECVTGRAPFRRAGSLATLWAHLHDEPPAPSMLVPGLPTALDAVVQRALAKDPRGRHGSAGALAAAACEAVDGRSANGPTDPPAPRELPTGTVTFLFTDVEGSTRLLHEFGAEAYAEELEEHRRVVRDACVAEGGVEVDTQGDAFFFAFPSAEGALAAAASFTDRLASGPIRVRVGVHTGTPHVTSAGYVGEDVHRAARIAGSGHGGQVVISASTTSLLEPGANASRGFALGSLGAHRLKDFDGPVTLFQLGDGSFPPLKTIANTNLPTPASSFLGRDGELYEADRLLQGTRLLTVTGPGGTGKTRFALELARRAREDRFSDYEDGVFSCFLAPLRDPALVLGTVAQALSVPEQPGRSALEAVADVVEGRRMLLLLDNFEHVLSSARELVELLAACPGLTLLVTSRQVLRVDGELAYELPPLDVDDGLALFCERAHVQPSSAVRELCRRLEGLPLAIELAAARMRILSPEQLLARLSGRLDLLRGSRNADPRQQTLRATIEWSYELLEDDARLLLAALSVFAGGCTLEATEEVAGAQLDTLESLLDRSLLRRMDTEHGPRFWMLETIREFAAERLQADAGAAEVHTAHARHYAAVAEHAEPHLTGPGGSTWIARLEADLENFRVALRHSLDSGERELALRLATDLSFFWHWRGRNSEGRRWLEEALGDGDVGSASLRARALNRASVFAIEQDDGDAVRQLNERSLALAREAGDREAEATALHDLSGWHLAAGSWRPALERLEEARALFVELGDEAGVVISLVNSGTACRLLGDLDEARAFQAEAARRARALGNEHFTAIATCELGISELERSNLVEAGGLVRDSLRIAVGSGNLVTVPWILWVLAVEAARAGDAVRAARLAGAAERSSQETGAELDPFDLVWVEAALARARDALGHAVFDAEKDRGADATSEESIAYALEPVDPGGPAAGER